jgi:putative transposase
MLISEYYPEYFTATILNWTPLLLSDKNKQVITGSLQYLVDDNRVKVFGFAIIAITFR